MAFELAEAALPVDGTVQAELRHEWWRLASPGTWFTGSERVLIAFEARAARGWADADSGLREPVIEAAQSVSAAAEYVTRDWIAELLAEGMTIEEYVEVVGVVGRLSAVDSYLQGVGACEEPLPTPVEGEPSRRRNSAARWHRAFVPVQSENGAVFTLSAVPAEKEAMLRLLSAMYLTPVEMNDFVYSDELSRAQIEFLAIRVSYLNHCYY